MSRTPDKLVRAVLTDPVNFLAFGGLMQPLIVVSAIPFGVLGAVWGHVLMGKALTVV